MADIVKNISSLQLVTAFTDGDDRTITVDSPKASIDAAAINELSDYIKQNQCILGDNNSTFVKFKDARIITDTETILDIE